MRTPCATPCLWDRTGRLCGQPRIAAPTSCGRTGQHPRSPRKESFEQDPIPEAALFVALHFKLDFSLRMWSSRTDHHLRVFCGGSREPRGEIRPERRRKEQMGHFPVQAQVGLEEKYGTVRRPLKCRLQGAHSNGFHAEDMSPLVKRPAGNAAAPGGECSCPRPPFAGPG